MRKTVVYWNVVALTAIGLMGCSPSEKIDATVASSAGAVATKAASAQDGTVVKLAKECLGCHAKAISLADIPADEMPSAIRGVIAGEVVHPTQVPELTEAQLAELAKLLRVGG